MIVVDSSAIVAIVNQEPEARLFSDRISADSDPLISAATAIECGVVLMRRAGDKGREVYERVLASGGVRFAPVEATHVTLALDAFGLYGKGMGHPAQLNLGDCFSYALAKSTGAPLLFKGTDFSQTDVLSAL